MSKHRRSTPFSLEGQFLGFLLSKHGKLKGVRLLTAQGERNLKLAKELRSTIRHTWQPGDEIRVLGVKVEHANRSDAKWKVQAIYPMALTNEPLPPERSAMPAEIRLPNQAGAQPHPRGSKPITILYCQKSDCMKRGGRAVCTAMMAALAERGLEGKVKFKGTGCMKQCKAGPNLVVMPDKTRYARITPNQVPTLLDQHVVQAH